jgi:formimidoylglutamate deiminase
VIAPGRWADLLALDVSGAGFEGLAGDAVLDAWLFAATRPCVDRVWSAGRAVVTAGRHPGRPAIEARFRTVLRRLRSA